MQGLDIRIEDGKPFSLLSIPIQQYLLLFRATNSFAFFGIITSIVRLFKYNNLFPCFGTSNLVHDGITATSVVGFKTMFYLHVSEQQIPLDIAIYSDPQHQLRLLEVIVLKATIYSNVSTPQFQLLFTLGTDKFTIIIFHNRSLLLILW